MLRTKGRRLRASFAFAKVSNSALLARGQAIVNGMTGNPAYTNPPVDPAALKAALDKFAVAIGEAAYGDKRAIAERDQQGEAVVDMLRELKNYVDAKCRQDLPTLLSSGFEVASLSNAPAQPLEPPTIRSITQGSTGQLFVKVKNMGQAWSYEVRFAALDANGTPGPWTTQGITAVRSPASCAGLTPGSTYAFQIRALGRMGYSDWSHPIAKMCT